MVWICNKDEFLLLWNLFWTYLKGIWSRYFGNSKIHLPAEYLGYHLIMPSCFVLFYVVRRFENYLPIFCSLLGAVIALIAVYFGLQSLNNHLWKTRGLGTVILEELKGSKPYILSFSSQADSTHSAQTKNISTSKSPTDTAR